MSTVVLTPTHMACDHTVVHKTYPHHSYVDCHHQKIFVQPANKYMIGHVGEFNPAEINKEETWDHIGLLLALLVAHQKTQGFSTYPFHEIIASDENGHQIDYKKTIAYYFDVFDFLSKTFIVTRQYRFLIAYSKTEKKLYGKALGDYAGIGSGGMLAAGMLIGGMALEKIWEPLNILDNLSSREYSCHALSSLKSVRIKKS